MTEPKINIQGILWLPKNREVLRVNFEGGYFTIDSDGDVGLSIHDKGIRIKSAQLNDRVYKSAVEKNECWVRFTIEKTQQGGDQ